MRNKISFGSFFEISSSELVVTAVEFTLLLLLLLKCAVVVLNVCEVVTEPLRVVMS